VKAISSTAYVTTFALPNGRDNTANLNTWGSSRISSACSCLIGTASTTTTTKTIYTGQVSTTLSTKVVDVTTTLPPSTAFVTSTVQVVSTSTAIETLYCNVYADPDIPSLTQYGIGSAFTTPDLAGCALACNATANCQSYIWGDTSKICSLYIVHLTQEITQPNPLLLPLGNKVCPNFLSFSTTLASSSSTVSSTNSSAVPTGTNGEALWCNVNASPVLQFVGPYEITPVNTTSSQLECAQDCQAISACQAYERNNVNLDCTLFSTQLSVANSNLNPSNGLFPVSNRACPKFFNV
jgi:hypothetical protein